MITRLRRKWFANLSIHEIGLIGANLAAITVVLFASIIIHQEYLNYQKEVVIIEATYQHSLKEKNQILDKKRDEHKKKIMKYIVGIGGLSLFMYFTIFGISRVISYIIENEIDNFIKHFRVAAIDFKPLDREYFWFEEFKEMANDANLMVSEIQNKQNELEILNISLEDKVKEKTAKLENLIKAQDEFVKKSIHEINTPLSIILTSIDLLKMKNIQNKQLTNIESASKMINNIYNDLSYLIKKDRVVYHKQRVDISDFLKDRVNFFDEIAKSNGLFFICNIEDGLFYYINDTLLARVIDNNLSNAIKYSYLSSPIKISLQYKENNIVFEINTYSQEIKDAQQIFSQYYREHQSRGGFGLGLSIVKEICDDNDIDIEVTSDDKINTFRYIFKNSQKDKNNANFIA